VRAGRGPHGVDGNADRAIGAVLEADRERDTRSELTIAAKGRVGASAQFKGRSITGEDAPVELRLGRPGADGSPRDEVSDELRPVDQGRGRHVTVRSGQRVRRANSHVREEHGRDGVEQLAADGHAGRGDVDQQLTGNPEALVDLERIVKVGVAVGQRIRWRG